MKINDLRIGNYIHPISYFKSTEEIDSHIYLQARIINESGGLICSNGRHLKPGSFAPVMMTPELKQKLGFIKTDFSGIPNMGGVMWRKMLPNVIVDIYDDKTVLNLNIPIPHITFLHQWQNLHYILTGQEIKIEV